MAAIQADAQEILGRHETSTARTITLEKSYSKLLNLSIDQDELFRESLRAIEHGLFRASHVLAWAGFMDFLHNHLTADNGAAVIAVRPKWVVRNAEDLREQSDYAVIEAGKAAGHYGKTIMKALHGLLNKRNECGHPSGYYPDLNQTLGYISELFQRLQNLRKP